MQRKSFTFLLIVIILGSCSGGNQTKNKIILFPGLESQDGIFYKKNANEPFTGSTKSIYSDENPYVIAMFKEGKLHGTYTAYYANGQKMGISHYKMGVKQGESIAWHENGQLASKVTFKNDKRTGLFEAYYSNGQQSTEAFFKAGELDSTYTRWEATGELFSIETYKNGELIEREYFKGGDKPSKVNI